MIPHTNNWGYLLLAVTLVAGVLIGWGLGHWRAYAECCDCCTCETCTEKDGPDLDEWDDEDVPRLGNLDEFPGERSVPGSGYPYAERRTILLEPGPTIYPALAELAGEVMDEPDSHSDASDSTFVRKLLIEWEQRYPIPVGAP